MPDERRTPEPGPGGAASGDPAGAGRGPRPGARQRRRRRHNGHTGSTRSLYISFEVQPALAALGEILNWNDGLVADRLMLLTLQEYRYSPPDPTTEQNRAALERLALALLRFETGLPGTAPGDATDPGP